MDNAALEEEYRRVGEVRFYENEFPAFLEVELERLYENVYSCASKFRIDGHVHNTTTYVLRRGGVVVTALVFRQVGQRVEVVNQCIKLDERDIRTFADAVFSTYRMVTLITFYAVHAAIRRLPFPFQCFTCLEDIVLALPETPELYFSRLGKSTRQNISRYIKVAQRNLPQYQFKICTTQDLTEQIVREVVQLSTARMVVKEQASLHDDVETAQLARLIRANGFVGLVMVDGRVCAGALCSRVGANYFLHVIAHDPQYDNYSLGTLCCYRTICAAISCGGKTFHFLWGRMDYKFRMLGVQFDLQRVAVYRSRLHLLLNGRQALQITIRGVGRLVKHWFLDPGRRDSAFARLALKLVNSAPRWLKR